MRLNKIRVKSQSLLGRFGGFSFFGIGASFKTPEPERAVVRDVITVLEDRRALYVSSIYEQPMEVSQSVMQIRSELTNALKRVGDSSPARDAFRLMRAACRDFLLHPAIQGKNAKLLFHRGQWEMEEFLIELGKLRAVFGQQIAFLGYLYDIDIEEQLASTLPPLPSVGEE